MSLEIDSLNNNNLTNSIPNNKALGLKNDSKPKDTVELSAKKKELSTGAKIGIGVGIAAILGVGIYKRKSLKNLWKKFWNCKSSQNADSSTSMSKIADFKDINTAKDYFENIGIKTVFKSGSERHLADLNTIRNDLLLLEKNEVALPKPESIIVSDWNNIEELKQIFRQLNIKEEQATICNQGVCYWGTTTKGTDNKIHILINSAFNGNYGKFIHEMGHVHQDYLKSSYWHSKGLNDKEFMQKQMDILGLSNIQLAPNFDTKPEYISSILRQHTAFNEYSSTSSVEKCKRIFPDITDQDYNKIFVIPDINGKTYAINAKKMVDKMARESHVYSPNKTWENVAEIFQKLNKGESENFSDLVLLMYDINGGGRVPKLVIKGKKYDDYIESLYNNSDLISQLRESIEVKEFV